MAQSGARGHMEIQDQKDTFHGFLMATVWTFGLIAQAVMLLTLAFAIGSAFKLSGVYWATQVALWVLLALGGLIVPALSGMMG